MTSDKFTELYSYRYKLILEHLYHPEKEPYAYL